MESNTTLSKMKKNLCSKYLVPTLEIVHNNFTSNSLKEFGFVNAYLEVHATVENIDILLNETNSIYLIFKLDKALEPKFISIAKLLKKDVPNFSGCYKLDDCVYVLGFYTLPKWVFILNLFKEGKYSAFGKSYADKFITGHKKDKKEPLEQYRVITRDPSYIQEKSEALGIDPSILSDIDLDEYPTKDDYVFYYKQTEVKRANIANNPYMLKIPKKLHGLSSLPKE